MKIFYFLLIILVCQSCLKEENVSTAKTNTFLRYFNGGNNDNAETFYETSDKGFIILATTEIAASDPTASPTYKIKLIRTDDQGAVIWQKLFPEFDQSGSYKGHSLCILADESYVIAGEDVQYNNGVITHSKALLMKVSKDGTAGSMQSFDPVVLGESRSGQAVGVNAAGNFMLLTLEGASDMYMTEIRSTDLVPYPFSPPLEGYKKYSAGSTTIANHLYINSNDEIYWGGTGQKLASTGARLIGAYKNDELVIYEQFLHAEGFITTGNDFTPYGADQFMLIGSTDQKPDGSVGDKDIMYVLADGSPTPRYNPRTVTYPLGANDTQDDIGEAIAATSDGGAILLGTVDSKAVDGRGDKDLLLIKIYSDGTEYWKSSFGSRFPEKGKAVRQVSDGNFVVLGNSVQGNLSMILLAKTDQNGKIQ